MNSVEVVIIGIRIGRNRVVCNVLLMVCVCVSVNVKIIVSVMFGIVVLIVQIRLLMIVLVKVGLVSMVLMLLMLMKCSGVLGVVCWQSVLISMWFIVLQVNSVRKISDGNSSRQVGSEVLMWILQCLSMFRCGGVGVVIGRVVGLVRFMLLCCEIECVVVVVYVCRWFEGEVQVVVEEIVVVYDDVGVVDQDDVIGWWFVVGEVGCIVVEFELDLVIGVVQG